MLPSRSIRLRIQMLQKARDKCIQCYNATQNMRQRELLQLATVALSNTQYALEAELHLLTTDGQTNSN